MWYLVVKAAISGVVIAIVSEVARRSPALGAMIVSLPLLSLMAFLWMWHDTHDVERIARLAGSTFWMVLPTLPLFLVLPVLLRGGVGFYFSLVIVVAMTIALYMLTVWVMKQFFGYSF